MANLNRIILIGRLFEGPESRFTIDGTPMTRFKIEVSRLEGSDRRQSADYIDIVAWRKLAEICSQYLKKGSLVLVEGRIQVRSFNDENGQKKWVTEVVARNLQMLDAQTKIPIKEIEESSIEEFDSGLDIIEEAEEDIQF